MVTLQWLASAKVCGKDTDLDQRMWSVTQDVPQKQASDNIAMVSKALPLWRKSICHHKTFNTRQAANKICHDSSVYVCACL